MSRRIAPIGLWTLLWIAIALSGAPAVARASNPHAIYVVPSKVELLPNANAPTSVMLHGAFFFWTNNGYIAPKCGYMSFTCAPGSEAMCRAQWADLVRYGQSHSCAGFGSLSMMSAATFYKEGDPPGKPDTWDLGMGVSEGFWVDGKCDPAKQLSCGGVAPPPDMSMPQRADLAQAPADMAQAPADLAVAPSDLTAPPPPQDLSKPVAIVDQPSACAVGSHRAAPGVLLPLGLLLGLALRGRRRR